MQTVIFYITHCNALTGFVEREVGNNFHLATLIFTVFTIIIFNISRMCMKFYSISVRMTENSARIAF